MLVDMNHAARLQERFRGLMVGLALGDSIDFLYDEHITPGPATRTGCLPTAFADQGLARPE